MKQAAKFSSETSVNFYQTTRRYIPDNRIIYNQGCKNLTCYESRYVRLFSNFILEYIIFIFIYIIIL
jgi:hypothetical protein